jgi:hypothetical protein
VRIKNIEIELQQMDKTYPPNGIQMGNKYAERRKSD